ncbi:MAG: TolC family protein [Deltaproteobacteria bacterium]|nr:TolC family protein [Deltaproteobacteria bacterium]
MIYPFIFISLISALTPFEKNIQTGLEKNSDIAAARAQVKAVEASHLPQKFDFLPQIGGEVTQAWSKNDNDDEKNARHISASASMKLFEFGAGMAGRKAAQADVRRAQAELDSKILSVEGEIILAMVNQLLQEEELEIQRQLVATREQSLSLAEARYKQGILPRQEADTFLVDLENARSKLQDLEVEEKKAKAEVFRLLENSGERFDWPWKNSKSQAALILKSELNFESIPSWHLAKATFENMTELSRQGFREIFPSLNGNFEYGLRREDEANKKYWLGSFTLAIPIFNRFQEYGNYKSLNYQAEAARARLVSLEKELKRNFDSAHAAFESSMNTSVKRDENLQISHRLYEDNLKRFRIGRVSANDLVIDQNRLQDSKFLASSGWAAYHLNLMKLCHSLGRSVNQCLGLSL